MATNVTAKKKSSEPKKAEEGAIFMLASDAWNVRYDEPEELVIKPSCGGKPGRWVCVTHGVGPMTQFQKDLHTSPHSRSGKPCSIAWLCPEHGAEVP